MYLLCMWTNIFNQSSLAHNLEQEWLVKKMIRGTYSITNIQFHYFHIFIRLCSGCRFLRILQHFWMNMRNHECMDWKTFFSRSSIFNLLNCVCSKPRRAWNVCELCRRMDCSVVNKCGVVEIFHLVNVTNNTTLTQIDFITVLHKEIRENLNCR
jgi:hypothetical protein